MKTKVKILQLCEFSSGACGVWTRALQDSRELVKRGYDVTVFSSNQVKGKPEETALAEEVIDGIKIKRFPVKRQIGENILFWNFKKEFYLLAPDIVIAHNYRHPHTNKAVRYARKHDITTILITHSPFVDTSLRGWKLQLGTVLYDMFIGGHKGGTLSRFDKVVRITNWEVPYLEKLGCKDSILIPNGIPDEFFEGKIKKGKGILYLGRISPRKKIEILIEAVQNIDVYIDIVGPYEEKYLWQLQKLCLDIQKGGSKAGINFQSPVYDLKEKIKEIDAHEIFVLPSKWEGMPQALIEAMARGKIVIASDTDGAKEVIVNGQNGFLFENGSAQSLREKIQNVMQMPEADKDIIRQAARKSVEKYKISALIDKLEEVMQ